MASVNKVILLGTLGRDPELRHTQGGQAVCNLNIATNRKWTDKSGEKQEEVEWSRVVVWGKQAESCAQYLTKGRQCYVEGRLKTTSYEKEGEKKYATDIIAETVKFLGGKSDKPAKDDTYETPSEEDDDNVPF